LRCPYTWSQKRIFCRSPWSLYISYVVNLIQSSVISVHNNFCSFLDFEHSSLIFLWWTGEYLDLPWASVDYGKVVIYWRFFGPEERNCVFLTSATTVFWRFCVFICIYLQNNYTSMFCKQSFTWLHAKTCGFSEIWSILDSKLKLTSSSYRSHERSPDHPRFVLLNQYDIAPCENGAHVNLSVWIVAFC